MIKFLIDEDMPRSTAKILRARGFDVLDVRDCGLRGKSDDEIFQYAQREKAVILTGDTGFGNLLHFPIGSHFGIAIAHFSNEISTSELNSQIIKALDDLADADLKGNLIILEPGRIRIRRK